MKDNRTIMLGIRLSKEEKEKLDKIVNYYKGTQSSVIRYLIEREYEKILNKN